MWWDPLVPLVAAVGILSVVIGVMLLSEDRKNRQKQSRNFLKEFGFRHELLRKDSYRQRALSHLSTVFDNVWTAVDELVAAASASRPIRSWGEISAAWVVAETASRRHSYAENLLLKFCPDLEESADKIAGRDLDIPTQIQEEE